ncbi:hypothetical protein T07_11442 [Trichinella nelsoni]|uniref:Uncharacterized protein n=1 Tax=Trichinella nelsoni TaxID=6336 RepID=A0A0V0S389_9BILA|nr:hypothetical protein T07_11442 [Trichinella nelsoni]
MFDLPNQNKNSDSSKKARQLYIEIQNHNSICRFISNSFQGPHTLREILFIERLDKLPFIEWKRMTVRLKRSHHIEVYFLAILSQEIYFKNKLLTQMKCDGCMTQIL